MFSMLFRLLQSFLARPSTPVIFESTANFLGSQKQPNVAFVPPEPVMPSREAQSLLICPLAPEAAVERTAEIAMGTDDHYGVFGTFRHRPTVNFPDVHETSTIHVTPLAVPTEAAERNTEIAISTMDHYGVFETFHHPPVLKTPLLHVEEVVDGTIEIATSTGDHYGVYPPDLRPTANSSDNGGKHETSAPIGDGDGDGDGDGIQPVSIHLSGITNQNLPPEAPLALGPSLIIIDSTVNIVSGDQLNLWRLTQQTSVGRSRGGGGN